MKKIKFHKQEYKYYTLRWVWKYVANDIAKTNVFWKKLTNIRLRGLIKFNKTWRKAKTKIVLEKQKREKWALETHVYLLFPYQVLLQNVKAIYCPSLCLPNIMKLKGIVFWDKRYKLMKVLVSNRKLTFFFNSSFRIF